MRNHALIVRLIFTSEGISPYSAIMADHASEETVAVRADATERSLRSFIQGFLLDIVVAVTLVLATAFGAIEWTPLYWKALGLTLAKSVLQAAVSYVMRVVVAPRRSIPA
jgi:hypothetical protein